MATPIRILAIALAVQLVLVAGVYWPEAASSRAGNGKSVLSINTGKVDQFSVTRGDSNEAVIQRRDGGWVLPGLSELPANSDQVESLMTQLNGKRVGLAVATSSEARERFKVGQESFKRRLELALADGTTKVLYFGTSPGANETYLRRKGEAAIHRVSIGTHLLPVKDESWMDEGLLSYKPEEIRSIKVNGLTISQLTKEKSGGEQTGRTENLSWQVSGLDDGREADQAAVKKFVRQFGSLRVSGISSTSQNSEAQPDFEVVITLKDGSSVTYSLYSAGKDKQKARLVSSGQDTVFTVASPTLEALVKAGSRETLTRSPESKEGKEGGEKGDTDMSATENA